MTWRDRVVDDGADRESWLESRRTRIGASDAGKFAFESSVEKYVRAKLEPRTFTGNEFTRNGHNWEPAVLAAAGFEQNVALIAHPTESRFVCTPDGYREDGGTLRLAEVKTRNKLITDRPKPSEIRQMAFQLHVIPEAEAVDFLWCEIVQDPRSPDGWKPHRPPQHLTFRRDSPEIVAATNLIVPIAHAVLERLDAARLVRTPF